MDTPRMKLTKNQIAIIVIFFFAAFVVQLNHSGVSPLLPRIMAEKKWHATTAQWLMSGYNLTNAIFMALSAFMMARLTTRKQFFSAFTLFVAGCLLLTWGLNFPMMLVGRFLQGACSGIVGPLLVTVIFLVFPLERRGFAMGILTLVMTLGTMFGAVVAGIMSDKVSWHIFFLTTGTLALLIIVAAVLALKNFDTSKTAAFDKLSVVLCSVGLLCLLYGFSEFSKTELLPSAIALIIIGGIVLSIFVKRQLKLTAPLLEMRVFKTKQFVSGLIVLMILQFILAATTIILPIYIQTIRGMSATMAGLLLIPGTLLGAIFGVIGGRLSDRFGARPLVIVGGILLLCGGVGAVLLDRNTSMLYISVCFIPLIGGVMLSTPPTSSWTISSLSRDLYSHGNSVYLTLCQVMESMGFAIMVSIMSLVSMIYSNQKNSDPQMLGVRSVFISCIVISCVLFIFVLVNVKRKPHPNKTITDAVINSEVSTSQQ